MSTTFVQQSNAYRLVPNNNFHDRLPGKTFTVKKDMTGLFLEEIECFELPAKRYANNDVTARRILDTFLDRPFGTGVLLCGEKGSGKSLLAKTISAQAAKDGIPSIVINAPWTGDAFYQLIQAIEQPALVIFDEFEKVYSQEEQEQVLTLLDGMYPSKKLYLFTCNNKYKIDSNMKNRPGRIYYMLDFNGLAPEFIQEYCADNLKKQLAKQQDILKISQVFSDFNFDMLKALVEEINRYDEPPLEAVKMLNLKPEFSSQATFTISVKHETKKVKRTHGEFNGNPILQSCRVSFIEVDPCPPGEDPKDWDEDSYQEIIVEPKHMAGMDTSTGKYTFCKDGYTVELLREEKRHISAYDYIG